MPSLFCCTKNLHFFIYCTVCIFALAACAQVRQAGYEPALIPPPDAHPAPVGFSGVDVRLPTGEIIGHVGSNAVPGCLWAYHEAERSMLRNIVNKRDIDDMFRSALTGQGYDITGNTGFHFYDDFEDELLRSEYKVGAIITEVEMRACYEDAGAVQAFIRSGPAFRGEFYINVDWYIYDALRRNVVYRTSTAGYARHRRPNSEGLSLMLSDAFEMAAHNLGADRPFHELIFYGTKPPQSEQAARRHEDRPRQFDPRAAVELAPQPLSVVPFEDRADYNRRLAVLVQAAAGHGSGFFITPQGHILTNAHVIGDALRVRIVTADKEQALIAEVLRKDKARDVALLKLEQMPDDLDIVTLPVRAGWPRVGEAVYLIGAPRMRRLQDSISAGIISAHRRAFKFLGTQQDLFQADVSTHGGNSGGPLLDRHGNIIGLAHGGFAPAGLDQSLNMFIPIGAALAALDIEGY